MTSVRELTHIKRLDDCLEDFLVRVVCASGACREIQPQALARLVGWKMTLRELALRMRCSRCGRKAAEVVAIARPRPRGVPRIRTRTLFSPLAPALKRCVQQCTGYPFEIARQPLVAICK